MNTLNSVDTMTKLLDFLNDLDDHKIYHEIARHRNEGVMVLVAVPGERWEIEFFADGHVEVEVFRSNADGLGDEQMLAHLFDQFSDSGQ